VVDVVIPAISSKLYQTVITEMLKRPFNSPERRQLEALQRQLSEAQQAMLKDKTLDAWHKAG
jgi:hypothetical protein